MEEQSLAVRVPEDCRHGHRPRNATARRAPFGNDVRWQVRVFYDCPEGCFESGVFDSRPRRILFGEGEELALED